jgi:hypothetical protein
VQTEGRFWLQFNLGANFTFLDGNSFYRQIDLLEQESPFFESGTGLGPLVGLQFGYAFNKTFSLTARVDYDSKSAGNSGRATDTCLLAGTPNNPLLVTPVQVDKDYNVTVNYIAMSLIGEARFGNFLLYLGPSFSVPISHKITETDDIVDADGVCEFFALTPDSTKHLDGSLTNTDSLVNRLSLKFGLGYVINISPRISLVPEIGYDLGLYGVVADGTYSGAQTMYMYGSDAQRNDPQHHNDPEKQRINPLLRLSSLQATIGLRINI